MTIFELRHHLIIAGFVGTGLLAASSLAVWPQADAARLTVRESHQTTIAVVRAAAETSTINAASQQIPLSGLAFNPFAQRSAATHPADTDRLQLLASIRKLRLDSALCTESHRGCSINGNPFSEGDAVGLFQIEKISPVSVTLKNGVTRFELRLQP